MSKQHFWGILQESTYFTEAFDTLHLPPWHDGGVPRLSVLMVETLPGTPS